MSLAALIGIDKERYDQGNKFLSQDPYLQNFQARSPITFNESPVINQGIMGPRIYPYPPIITQEGDGGGGITFGRDKGEITSDVGFGNLNDQTGMGYTLTEEDKAEIAAQKNKNRLTQAAQLGLFALNPAGYALGKGIKGAYNFVKDRFFGGDGDSGSGGGGGKTKGPTDYYSPGGGYEGSDEQDRENEQAASGNLDAGSADIQDYADIYASGGRVGFGNGGLSTYEIFKLGELGFDTKGGTVTAPFGGIKVLRDILKVNQYAGGGIVGMYR